MSNKGFTLIEILIVIVVMGIIASFSVLFFGDAVSNSQIEADSYNLTVLNDATKKYATTVQSSNDDIFNGISADASRIEKLVTSGFIDRRVKPQQEGATFEWSVSNQTWNLIGGELSTTYFETTVSGYDFSSQTISEVEENGVVSMNIDKWTTEEGYLENTSGQTNLFIPITANTYTITVNAALNEGSNGGYGIFFDTTLRDGSATNDDGYVFQFDRGYAEGAMIVRPRTNGREGGPVWSLRANNTDIFPSESSDPDWWTASHEIKIVVTNVDESTRQAVFFIDGVNLGSMEYSNAITDKQVYTGFRGWGGSPTKYYNISVS